MLPIGTQAPRMQAHGSAVDELRRSERKAVEVARSKGQRAPKFERDQFKAWREAAP